MDSVPKNIIFIFILSEVYVRRHWYFQRTGDLNNCVDSVTLGM